MKNSTNTLAASALAALILAGTITGAGVTQVRETTTVSGVRGALGDHHLTFSGPIALPGVSLGTGTYIFTRPAPGVLQVFSADHRQAYAMVSTMPVTRRGRADQYEITLGPPVVSGAPRRLQAWFVAGESTGQQLIYPSR
jgi:hypothetical protein